MKTVKSYNKNTNTTYVYEVLENYWDKEKKQARSKRRMIGKIDPETGEMIPTTPRKKKEPDPTDYKALYKSACKDLENAGKELEEVKRENAVLNEKLRQKDELLRSLLFQIQNSL